MKTKFPEDLENNNAQNTIDVGHEQVGEITEGITNEIENFCWQYTGIFRGEEFKKIFNAISPDDKWALEKTYEEFSHLIEALREALKMFKYYYGQKWLVNPSFQTEQQVALNGLVKCYGSLSAYNKKRGLFVLPAEETISKWITGHISFFHAKIYFPVECLMNLFKAEVFQYNLNRVLEKLKQLEALKNTNYLTLSTQEFNEISACLAAVEENLREESLSDSVVEEENEEIILKKSCTYSLIETIKQRYGVESVGLIWAARVQPQEYAMSVEELQIYYNADTKLSELVKGGVAIGYLLEQGISVKMLLQDGVSVDQLRFAGVAGEQLPLPKKQIQEPTWYYHRFSFFSKPSGADDEKGSAFRIIIRSTEEPVIYLHLAHFYLICKDWKSTNTLELSRSSGSLPSNCINLILWFVLLSSGEGQQRQLYEGRLGEDELETNTVFLNKDQLLSKNAQLNQHVLR